MSRQHIANVLKKLRAKSGLTADQVGERIGRSGKTINGWENNRSQPDADTLLLLCEIYEVEDILATFSEDDPAVRENFIEKSLLDGFRQLNNDGQNKTLAYIRDLKNSGNYSKRSGESSPQSKDA